MGTTPNDYTYRHPIMEDLRAALHIQRTAGIADFGSSDLTEETLQANWETGRTALDTDAWLVSAQDGTPVAYAEASQSNDPVWSVLWVLPEHRGEGIEDTLLHLAERRTLEHAASGVIRGRASHTNLTVCRAYEQAGYSRYLSFQIMENRLNQLPPEPAWPAEISVRTFVPGLDEHITYEVDEEASEDKGYHSPLTFDGWAERMGIHTPRFDPTLWFLAWRGPDLAGVALNYYDSESSTGWIDHLGVRRLWRKQGLGRSLLLHAFREFYQRRVPTVKLSVDSGSLTNAPRLYTRVGMEVVQFYHIYRKELGPITS
ncbi:MAG: GNAT family N-acetyltransferase [Chloroflexota bacterium]|nr:GNAT family N-acetyltransferase [Chloroflexota bacterium]